MQAKASGDNLMRHLSMEIDLQEEKKAKALVNALSGGKPKRSKVTLRSNGSKLLMDVKAEDDVALRSVVNSHLRLADACLKIIEV